MLGTCLSDGIQALRQTLSQLGCLCAAKIPSKSALRMNGTGCFLKIGEETVKS